MKEIIPYYVINEPYELFYKNSSTNSPVGAHTHNKAEIYLTLTDLPDALLNDTVSHIPQGTLILIPPFCVHQMYHQKNIRYERYILNLDTQWLDNVTGCKQDLSECLKHSTLPLIIPLSEEQLSAITQYMQKVLPVIREKSIKNTAEFLNLLSVLDSAVHNIRKNKYTPGMFVSKSQTTVNEIIAFINEHIEKDISLADIEEHFFLNRDYLSRLFLKHTHISIGRYVSIQRIAKAQEYLSEGFPVAQVSDKLGFSSYAYFFKVFKKIVGISPSQYRKNAIIHEKLDLF